MELRVNSGSRLLKPVYPADSGGFFLYPHTFWLLPRRVLIKEFDRRAGPDSPRGQTPQHHHHHV